MQAEVTPSVTKGKSEEGSTTSFARQHLQFCNLSDYTSDVPPSKDQECCKTQDIQKLKQAFDIKTFGSPVGGSPRCIFQNYEGASDAGTAPAAVPQLSNSHTTSDTSSISFCSSYSDQRKSPGLFWKQSNLPKLKLQQRDGQHTTKDYLDAQSSRTTADMSNHSATPMSTSTYQAHPTTCSLSDAGTVSTPLPTPLSMISPHNPKALQFSPSMDYCYNSYPPTTPQAQSQDVCSPDEDLSRYLPKSLQKAISFPHGPQYDQLHQPGKGWLRDHPLQALSDDCPNQQQIKGSQIAQDSERQFLNNYMQIKECQQLQHQLPRVHDLGMMDSSLAQMPSSSDNQVHSVQQHGFSQVKVLQIDQLPMDYGMGGSGHLWKQPSDSPNTMVVQQWWQQDPVQQLEQPGAIQTKQQYLYQEQSVQQLNLNGCPRQQGQNLQSWQQCQYDHMELQQRQPQQQEQQDTKRNSDQQDFHPMDDTQRYRTSPINSSIPTESHSGQQAEAQKVGHLTHTNPDMQMYFEQVHEQSCFKNWDLDEQEGHHDYGIGTNMFVNETILSDESFETRSSYWAQSLQLLDYDHDKEPDDPLTCMKNDQPTGEELSTSPTHCLRSIQLFPTSPRLYSIPELECQEHSKSTEEIDGTRCYPYSSPQYPQSDVVHEQALLGPRRSKSNTTPDTQVAQQLEEMTLMGTSKLLSLDRSSDPHDAENLSDSNKENIPKYENRGGVSLIPSPPPSISRNSAISTGITKIPSFSNGRQSPTIGNGAKIARSNSCSAVKPHVGEGRSQKQDLGSSNKLQQNTKAASDHIRSKESPERRRNTSQPKRCTNQVFSKQDSRPRKNEQQCVQLGRTVSCGSAQKATHFNHDVLSDRFNQKTDPQNSVLDQIILGQTSNCEHEKLVTEHQQLRRFKEEIEDDSSPEGNYTTAAQPISQPHWRYR